MKVSSNYCLPFQYIYNIVHSCIIKYRYVTFLFKAVSNIRLFLMNVLDWENEWTWFLGPLPRNYWKDQNEAFSTIIDNHIPTVEKFSFWPIDWVNNTDITTSFSIASKMHNFQSFLFSPILKFSKNKPTMAKNALYHRPTTDG